MTVCFLITCSQGELWIPTLSRSCSRVTESCKALVRSQRNTRSGPERAMKGLLPLVRVVIHTQTQVSVIWEQEKSFAPALFLHSSLAMKVWFLLETRNWATGTPDTVTFMSLF